MIKILFFIPTLSGGGAEKVLCNLVNNMDQTSFDITVQTIFKEDVEKYLNSGIHYKSINNYKNSLIKKIFHFWIRVCAEMRIVYPLYMKDDYDIEVAYLECGATKMLSSSTNKKALKLAWVHCDLKKKEGMIERFDRIKKYYDKYDHIVCVSNEVKKSFDELYGRMDRSTVLYNVINEEDIFAKSKIFNVPQISKRIVAVGRLSYEKGFDRLIEVCNLLKKDGYVFEVLILGEGPERKHLEKMIGQYNLDDVVKLKGYIENPYPYISSADIVVCTSRYEGFSTVIVESAILGKAIVTTPCAGMKEILGDSEYGVVTEDTIEDFYRKIKKLLEDRQKIEKYSVRAKKRAEAFSRNTIVGETEAFLKKLLKEKQN